MKLTCLVATYPGYLILVFGIPFVFTIVLCVLGCSGYFICVMGNGIKHRCRRAQKRREGKREQHLVHDNERWLTKEHGKRQRMEMDTERELEKRRRKERQEWEKAQKHARRHQKHPVTVPETVHLSPSSSINFNGSRRLTHGSSARIAGSDSLYDTPANGVSGTRSQNAAWNGDLEQGLEPDDASVHTRASSQSRAHLQKRGRRSSVTSRSQAPISIRDDTSMYSSSSTQRRNRLQKGYRGHSKGTLSHGSLSQTSHHSEHLQMGSVGSSSRLFNDRGSIDQRSTSAQGLLSERH